jgi:DNA polymerase III sliding clamp (beta) subunit (PCNA family)
LQYAARLVKGVASEKATFSDIPGTLIVASEDRAEFTSSSPEMQVKATVKIKGSVPGQCAINIEDLYNAVSKFQNLNDKGEGTRDVEVCLNSSNKALTISTETVYPSGAVVPHKRSFGLLNHNRIPKFPKVETDTPKVSIPASTLMDAVEGVLYAASNNRNEAALSGILLIFEDKRLTAVGADGVCIAEYTATVPQLESHDKVIITGPFAARLTKSFFDDDVVSISFDGNRLIANTPNFSLCSSLVNASYPDYKSVVPEPTVYISLDQKMLIDQLMNISYEAAKDKDDNRVSLEFDNKQLTLRAGGSENAGIATDFDGSVKVDCKLNLLIQSINNIQGETVKLGYLGERKPLSFYPEDGLKEGLRTVLVPLAPM